MSVAFYDCGAYGLFTNDTEKWQPEKRGHRSDPETFCRDTETRLFDPVWYNFGPIIKAIGGKVHVIDVGGYIGTFSIPLAICAAQNKCDLTFDVFEPGPTIDVLQRNISINLLDDKISVHNVAVSTEVGEVVYRWRNDGSIGGQVFSDAGTNESKAIPSVTIDYICENLKSPLLIKLDTQGHEHSIMGAARETIRAKKAIWQIEFMESSAKTIFEENQTFAEFLQSEFFIFDVRTEVTLGQMNSLVSSLNSRPSRMTDLVLIPKDAPYSQAAVAGMKSRP